MIGTDRNYNYRVYGNHIFDSPLEYRPPAKDERNYFPRESELYFNKENYDNNSRNRVNSIPNKTPKNYSDIFNLNDPPTYRPLKRVCPQSISQKESDIFFLKNRTLTLKNSVNSINDDVNDYINKNFNDNNIYNNNINDNDNKKKLYRHNSMDSRLNGKFEFKHSRNKSSGYNPDPYYGNKTAFQRKMADLFHGNKKAFQGFINKDLTSSLGYIEKETNEYGKLDKDNDDNNTNKISCKFNNKKNNYRNHRIKNDFYEDSKKFEPGLTAKENYKRCNISAILDDKYTAKEKIFLNEEKEEILKEEKIKKEQIRKEKNLEYIKNSNIKLYQKKRDNDNNWVSGLNWYDNTEKYFKNKHRSMSALDRKYIDQVDSVISYGYKPENGIYKNKQYRISMERENKLNEYKKYEPPSNLPISKINKIKDISSNFNNKNFYYDGYKMRKIKPSEFSTLEYVVKNCGNLDINGLQKKLYKKGIHVHEIKEENKNVLNFNIKDIKFKIRTHNGYLDKDKIKEVEKDLKMKNKRIQINEIEHKNMNKAIHPDIYRANQLPSRFSKNEESNKNSSNRYNSNSSSIYSNNNTSKYSKICSSRGYGRNNNFTKEFNNGINTNKANKKK